MSKEVEININAVFDKSIDIKMTCDSDIGVFDFIRILESLSENTKNSLAQHCSDSNVDFEDLNGMENIMLSDLKK